MPDGHRLLVASVSKPAVGCTLRSIDSRRGSPGTAMTYSIRRGAAVSSPSPSSRSSAVWSIRTVTDPAIMPVRLPGLCGGDPGDDFHRVRHDGE